MFQHLNRYDFNLPFKAWLKSILINTAISHYRKNVKYIRDAVGLEEAVYFSCDDGIIDYITANEVLKLVQQIKPLHRSVFLMYAVDGYSHREIADLLEMNEKTVRSYYARARKQLQHLIRNLYPELFPVSKPQEFNDTVA